MSRLLERRLAMAMLFAPALVTSACEDPETTVQLHFRAVVGDAPFACGTSFEGLGTSATRAEFSDMRFYVSDIVLISNNGAEVPASIEGDGRWQLPGVALLDFEDRSGLCTNGTEPTRTFVNVKADGSDFTGVRFTIGVPFDVNHGDTATAPSPLNLSGLFWNWQAGYKFMRIDAKLDGGRGFNLHVGSIGCSMDIATTTVKSCERPNRAVFSLSDFNPETDAIVLDVAELIADVDLSADAGGAPGCMSTPDDPECRPVFEALGLSVDDAATHDRQTVFSAGPR